MVDPAEVVQRLLSFLAAAQMPSARAAQARSPILFTASFEAKNSAQTQNTAKPTQMRANNQRHTPRRRRSGRLLGAPGRP